MRCGASDGEGHVCERDKTQRYGLKEYPHGGPYRDKGYWWIKTWHRTTKIGEHTWQNEKPPIPVT